MAAYRADIEIGVKGAARLKELQERITKLSRSIDDANVKTLIDRNAIQSVNEYSSALTKASNNLRETAIQLDAAGRASGNYAQAISQYVTALGQSNAAQKLNNDLIADEIELRRKAKLAAAGIKETVQYAGPIGPGAASAVALASPLRGRTQQILDERQGAKELEAALATLEERRRRETNAALDEKAAMVALRLEREKERASVLAGAAQQYAFPIGPSPSTRRFRFEGDVSAGAAEQALRSKELKQQRALNQQLFAEERAQLVQIDRLREENAKRQTVRIQNLGKAIRGSLSSAAIGGAFPLLFGQSPQAAVGGAIGGLLGGAAGGFAGSLIGTALGEIEAAKARVKELSTELNFSSTQAATLAAAFQLAGRNSQQLEAAVINIQGLGLSTNETASAIKIAVELSKEYGGSVEKIAQAFADTLESGKVSISTLNKFTAQGIPIQEQLATKLGVNRTKLLEMAKDGRISVQQVTDALVEMGRQAESTTDKGANGFDRFTQAVSGIATAIAGAAGAILKNLIPALDAVLSKLAAIITRATTALSLIADAQVGEASAALFRAGATRGTFFGMFAQSKGVIDDLTGGLKTLNPLLAKNQDELDKFSAVAGRYQKELQNYGGQVGEYSVKTAQVELSRVKNDIARRAAQLGAPKPAGLTIEDIVAPANLPPSGTKGAGKEKGKTALQNSIKRTEALKVEAQTLLLAAGIQDKINAAERIGAEQLALRLGFERDRAKLIGEYAAQEQKLANTANKNEEALALRKKRNAELVALQLKYENESAALDVKRLAPGYEKQTQLQNEAFILEQTLLGKGEEARLQVEIANAVKGLDATQTQAIANQMRKNFELQKQLDIAMQMKQLYTDIGMTIKDGVVGAIQGAIDGTKTLQQVATDVLTSIANKLLDVAINMALFGALSGAGTGGGLLGGLFPNIFQKRASGGSVMGGTPYMVGERGPELFVPGRSGTIVPNSSMGSTGATSVVVNVDASGSNVQGSDGQAGQLGKAIGIAVQQELIKQKRPGGLLAGV